MKRNQVLLAICSLLLANDPAFARSRSRDIPLGNGNTNLSGRIYTDQYLFLRGADEGTLEQSSLSAWLDFDTHSESGLGLRAIGQFDAFYRSILNPAEPSFKAQLREGYVSYLGTGTEIKIGQQIIPWGKSDGVNPTDYFTAKDYTLLNPDDEVRRLGALAANLSFTPKQGTSPFTFQFVVQANYPQTKLLIPAGSIPAGISFQRYPDAPVPFQMNSFEFGGKISFQKPDFDFSISAFSGYTHFPQYIVDPATLSVRPITPAETAVGGDASFTLDAYIVRLESALHMPENGRDTDPLAGLVQPWHWDSVVGVERPIGDDFRAQFQFLYRWYVYYRNPTIATANPALNQLILGVANANALILNYQRQGNPGATFRLGYASEQSDFSADVFLIGYFSQGQDYLLRPQLGYTPITNLKFTLGADIYGGDESRPLGALRDRTHAFFEGKYVF
jgi:hypothetical protein